MKPTWYLITMADVYPAGLIVIVLLLLVAVLRWRPDDHPMRTRR